ncbi:MAG: alpha/beta hydrolase family protein [Clostridium sp.]|nr:alpha/beta hydrolase family protein [Clostridium sp.]
MKKHVFLSFVAFAACLSLYALRPADSLVVTHRPDGLYLSSRGVVQHLMQGCPPSLAFHPDMNVRAFRRWQRDMKRTMSRLMRHPEAEAAAPRLVCTVERDGYRIEKWESYPLQGAVVPYLVMIPDGVDGQHPVPAVLCIPGFGQTKELLAGETPGDFNLQTGAVENPGKNSMGLHFVRSGLVAVVVDNVSFGELADNGRADYLNTSRMLLEMGWSYLGLTSWQDRVVLNWMKTQPWIDRTRIIVSGFSLGTEPLMALGLLDDSIYAFVYNDFLCTTRERILVMTKPDANGNRPFPNSIEHLIPEFLLSFDFPDIVAALAPRPVICTEGGLDRDFHKIERAYELSGAPDNFTYHHYAKYADPAVRYEVEEVPSGIDRTQFFRIVNCDPPHHYFKTEWVMPWTKALLQDSQRVK